MNHRKNGMNYKNQLTITKLLAMTFIPPLVTIILYIFSLQFRTAVPPLLSFVLIGLLVLGPMELIILLRENKKENGTFGLDCALTYNKKMSKPRAALLIVILFCIAGIAVGLVGGLEHKITAPFVNTYVPDYFIISNFVNQLDNYPKHILYITVALFFIADTLVLPVIEELYFRGYMMSKTARFGNFSPLIITILFSLYHFWLPWKNISRILGVLPYTYAVRKTENLYIGIFVHCLCNFVGSTELLAAVI